MATTVAYTERAIDYYFTIEEINAIFAAVKAVVDAKLDVRGSTLGADIIGVDCQVLNVLADDPEVEAV